MTTMVHDSGERPDAAQARPRPRPLRWAATLVALVLAAQGVVFLVGNPEFEWDVVAEYFTASIVLRGLWVTILLTVVAMSIGIVLGVVVAAARMSTFLPARAFAGLYVWFFRGTPVLVQLIFWYNLSALVQTISLGVPFGPTFFSWNTNSLISAFTAAILGLCLNEGAYMAEIIRAGLISVDRGQHDAARALGFSQAHTFMRIVLPQAMRFIVPPTGSQVITMLKGTSLVSVIAMADLLYSVQTIYNRTFQTIPLLVVAVVWYLLVTSVLFVGQSWIERYYSRGHRDQQPGARWPRARGRRPPSIPTTPAATEEAR